MLSICSFALIRSVAIELVLRSEPMVILTALLLPPAPVDSSSSVGLSGVTGGLPEFGGPSEPTDRF